MKLALTYGAAMAIAGAILVLVLFFAGLHDSVAKLQTAQTIGLGGGITIGVVCLALVMREKRAQFPAEEDWGYGSALGAGVLTAMFGSLFSLATTYAYFGIINPGVCDLILQAQLAAMEAKGMPSDQIEKIEPMMRPWMSPVALTLTQGLFGFTFSTLLALVVAIFFRQRAPAAGETSLPPIVG
jgi:hypothetical protein